MTIKLAPKRRRCVSTLAFTLVEVMVGVALLIIIGVSLFGGMSSGFAVTQASRENLRATQIILEKMEGIRLFNWYQLVYSNWIPSSFTNYYYPLTSPGESHGIAYYGTMSVDPVTLNPPSTYSTNMRAVSVTVNWTSAKIPRSRTLTTYVARDGIQNYVYAGPGSN